MASPPRATLDYGGVTYYFCSRECADSFVRYRDRYLLSRPDGDVSDQSRHQ